MANTNQTGRRTKSLDERIAIAQSRWDKQNEAIAKKGLPDPKNVIEMAQRTIDNEKLRKASEALEDLQTKKLEANIPKDVRTDLAVLRRSQKIASKYQAPKSTVDLIGKLESTIRDYYARKLPGEAAAA